MIRNKLNSECQSAKIDQITTNLTSQWLTNNKGPLVKVHVNCRFTREFFLSKSPKIQAEALPS